MILELVYLYQTGTLMQNYDHNPKILLSDILPYKLNNIILLSLSLSKFSSGVNEPLLQVDTAAPVNKIASAMHPKGVVDQGRKLK